MRELLRVPGYPSLFASSFIWHITRWGSLFTTSYLIAQTLDAPILNQILGALLITPLLLGGLVAGTMSDRLDRRRLVLAVQLFLIPVQFGMFALVLADRVAVWMTFPFMLALGLGALTNVTAQRVLLYETVGPELAVRAMPIESTALATSSMFGGLVGGLLIDRVGVAGGYFVLGVLLCISVLLLWRVPPPAHAAPRDRTDRASFLAQLAASASLIRRSRRLVGTLLVTVVLNLFLFGYLPLVPVVAKEFSSAALVAGLLGAAAGFGHVICGLTLTMSPIGRRTGSVFAAGSVIGLLGLLVLGLAPAYPIAWLGLFILGVGLAGFGSMQSILAMESTDESERGAALGLVGTAIGAQPIGMLWIGAAAEWIGTSNALLLSSVLGLVTIAIVLWRIPELLKQSPVRVRTPPR
ncbi:MFS transporter [Mycobacterium sp. C31M]